MQCKNKSIGLSKKFSLVSGVPMGHLASTGEIPQLITNTCMSLTYNVRQTALSKL
jgi:hypothetical protein